MGDMQAFCAYCSALQALIDAGVTMSVYIDSSIFDVQRMEVRENCLVITGMQDQALQSKAYQLPLDYINVSILTLDA